MASATAVPSQPHTPVQYGADSVYRNQQEIPQDNEKKQQLNRDIMKLILGTAPVHDFFDLLMATDPAQLEPMLQAISNADFSKVYNKRSRPTTERPMYNPLVEELNTGGYCPGYEAYKASDKIDTKSDTKYRPDIGLRRCKDGHISPSTPSTSTPVPPRPSTSSAVPSTPQPMDPPTTTATGPRGSTVRPRSTIIGRMKTKGETLLHKLPKFRRPRPRPVPSPSLSGPSHIISPLPPPPSVPNPPHRAPYSVPEGPFRWFDSEISIEVKHSSSEDPFDDDESHPVSKSGDGAGKVRGQLATYIKEQAERQHRTHIFQVFIFGSFARFLYWDRSGLVVSKKFDYVDNPKMLAEFFWRYSHLTDAQRGWDTSVVPATPDEVRDFDRYVPKLVEDLVGNRPNIPDYKITPGDTSYPTHKMVVRFTEGGREVTLITRRAFFQSSSPCGRATRGYIAYDPKRREIYFLKDTWRTAYEGHLSEAEVYGELEDHEVPHLPTILHAADVCSLDGSYQWTVVSKLAERRFSWNRNTNVEIRPLAHHRIVQKIAVPLVAAINSKEFVQAICHVVETIIAAHDNAHILHRDISINNVMIDPKTGGGILNDWDHSGPAPDCPTDESQPRRQQGVFRTGTWQFMSIALLENVCKIHSIHDDLQSVFWVLLFGALLHFAHNAANFDWDIFDHAVIPHDGSSMVTGGGPKRGFLVSPQVIGRLRFMAIPLNAIYVRLALGYSVPISAAATASNQCDARGNFINTPIDPDANMPAPQVILDIFKEVLTFDDWPAINDTLSNQYVPRTKAQANRASNTFAARSTGTGTGNDSIAASSASVITSAKTRSSGSLDLLLNPFHTFDTTPTSVSTGVAARTEVLKRNAKLGIYVPETLPPFVYNEGSSPPTPGRPPRAKRSRRKGLSVAAAGPSQQRDTTRFPSLQNSQKRPSSSTLLDEETPRKRRRQDDDNE